MQVVIKKPFTFKGQYYLQGEPVIDDATAVEMFNAGHVTFKNPQPDQPILFSTLDKTRLDTLWAAYLNAPPVDPEPEPTPLTVLTNVIPFEKSFEMMTNDERVASVSGGGYPVFAVSRESVDSPNYAIYSSATEGGSYTLDADNQSYTPSALIEGSITYDHRTLSISDEINFPVSVTPNTLGLIADSFGQKELCLLNGISTYTVGGETAKLLENIGVATHYSVPIQVNTDETARVFVLTNYGQDPNLRADGVRYYKITPKDSLGNIKPLSEITAIPFTVKSYRRKPNPPALITWGSADNNIVQEFPTFINNDTLYARVLPSSRLEVSSYFSPASAFELGVTVKMDVLDYDGAVLRTIDYNTVSDWFRYWDFERAQDAPRYSTPYRIYTVKDGINSDSFNYVINQRVPAQNQVQTVTLGQVSNVVNVTVALDGNTGAPYGDGTELTVYAVELLGALATGNITYDSITVGSGAELLYLEGEGNRFYVQVLREEADFTIAIPFTGGVGEDLTVRVGSIDNYRNATITIT